MANGGNMDGGVCAHLGGHQDTARPDQVWCPDFAPLYRFCLIPEYPGMET